MISAVALNTNMLVFTDTDLLKVARGEIKGHKLVQVFGTGTVNTTLSPITAISSVQVPTTAKTLEILSSSANDTAAGAGAQEITIEGLDQNWNESIQKVELNGVTAVALDVPLLRLNRWYVSRSGTYATQAAGSHQGNLTIQETGGGTIWDTIDATVFPTGQSTIGVYSIPKNKKAYLLSKLIFTDTNKVADIYMFVRENADDVVAPYSGVMQLLEREIGVQGQIYYPLTAPKQLNGVCDIGFMAKVTNGTADISVEFELLIIDND